MKLKKSILLGLSLVSLFTFTACNDDMEPAQEGDAQLRFNLTDAPANYNAVYIDLQGVEVKVGDTASSGWLSLNVQSGIYNLLDFQNGLDTLIGSGSVPAGRLGQIRLLLGPNNSVVTDTDSTSLFVPSGQQSGLKLLVNYELEAGLVYEFSLDFDAHRSIVQRGNGSYSLKPVIRVFTTNTTGSINGFLSPDSVYTGILAFNNNGDSASTVADTSSGYFLLAGLPAGNYTVEFSPQAPYNFSDTTNIPVNVGQITDLDTISL